MAILPQFPNPGLESTRFVRGWQARKNRRLPATPVFSRNDAIHNPKLRKLTRCPTPYILQPSGSAVPLPVPPTTPTLYLFMKISSVLFLFFYERANASTCIILSRPGLLTSVHSGLRRNSLREAKNAPNKFANQTPTSSSFTLLLSETCDQESRGLPPEQHKSCLRS